MKTFILSNGCSLPAVCFGTYNMHGVEAISSVKEAIRQGYRLIDEAAFYGNEKDVGEGISEAIAEGLVKREELIITSKVWTTHMGYNKTIQSFNQTLNDLNLNYLDLYLIHWPANQTNHPYDWNQINLDTWRALEDLYRVGKVKAIGVANFLPHHFKNLAENSPLLVWEMNRLFALQKDIIDVFEYISINARTSQNYMIYYMQKEDT